MLKWFPCVWCRCPSRRPMPRTFHPLGTTADFTWPRGSIENSQNPTGQLSIPQWLWGQRDHVTMVIKHENHEIWGYLLGTSPHFRIYFGANTSVQFEDVCWMCEGSKNVKEAGGTIPGHCLAVRLLHLQPAVASERQRPTQQQRLLALHSLVRALEPQQCRHQNAPDSQEHRESSWVKWSHHSHLPNESKWSNSRIWTSENHLRCLSGSFLDSWQWFTPCLSSSTLNSLSQQDSGL